jgi:hypothetical protein
MADELLLGSASQGYRRTYNLLTMEGLLLQARGRKEFQRLATASLLVAKKLPLRSADHLLNLSIKLSSTAVRPAGIVRTLLLMKEQWRSNNEARSRTKS